MVQTEVEDLSLVVEEADVLYVTRIQKERFASQEVRQVERKSQREETGCSLGIGYVGGAVVDDEATRVHTRRGHISRRPALGDRPPWLVVCRP